MEQKNKESKIIYIINKLPILRIASVLVFILFMNFGLYLFFVSTFVNVLIVYLSYVFLVLLIVRLCFNNYNNELIMMYTIVIILLLCFFISYIVEDNYQYLFSKTISTYQINSRESLVIEKYTNNNFRLIYKKRVRNNLIYKYNYVYEQKEKQEIKNLEEIYKEIEEVCPEMECANSYLDMYRQIKDINIFK